MSGPKAEILERSGWSRDYYGRLEDKAWLVQKGRKERRGERESARWNTFGETVSSFSRASRYLRVDRRFFLNFIFSSNLSLSFSLGWFIYVSLKIYTRCSMHRCAFPTRVGKCWTRGWRDNTVQPWEMAAPPFAVKQRRLCDSVAGSQRETNTKISIGSDSIKRCVVKFLLDSYRDSHDICERTIVPRYYTCYLGFICLAIIRR